MNQVVKKKETLPALSKLYTELEKDSGAGFEEMTSKDLAVPFVNVLQTLSAQLKKKNPAFVEGAEEGQIYNTGTGELFDGDEGVLFVPVFYERQYNEWVPRSEGGGLAGRHDESILQKTINQDGKLLLDNGNEIVEAGVYYGLLINDDGQSNKVVITMSKTQMKVSKKLLYRLSNMAIKTEDGRVLKGLPLYAYAVRLQTKYNVRGEDSWYLWHAGEITPLPQVPGWKPEYVSSILKEAKEFHKGLSEGRIARAEVAPEGQEASTEEASPTQEKAKPSKPQQDIDDEIPF